MTNALLLDARNNNYSHEQILELLKNFAKIVFIYNDSKQSFTMNDIDQITQLSINNKIEFFSANHIEIYHEPMFYAFIIGNLTKEKFNDFTIYSNNDSLINLRPIVPNIQINLKLNNEPQKDSSVTRPILKAPNINRKNTLVENNAIPTTLLENRKNKKIILQKNKPKQELNAVNESDVKIPTLDEDSYIFDASRKDIFTQTLSLAKNAHYFSIAENQFSFQIQLNKNSEGQYNFITNDFELSHLRLICFKLIQNRVQKGTKESFYDFIQKVIDELGTIDDIQPQALFTKLKKCYLIERIDNIFYVQKGFVLLFLSTSSLQQINKSLTNFEYLLKNHNYNQVIELGKTLSPKDIAIVSALAHIILTATDPRNRPKMKSDFIKALISMIGCTEVEAEYAIGLLKRYELILGENTAYSYNDAKLLRIASLPMLIDPNQPEYAEPTPQPIAAMVTPKNPVTPPEQQAVIDTTNPQEKTLTLAKEASPVNVLKATQSPCEPNAEQFILLKKLANLLILAGSENTPANIITTIEQFTQEHKLHHPTKSVYNLLLEKSIVKTDSENKVYIYQSIIDILNASDSMELFNLRMESINEYRTNISNLVNNELLVMSCFKSIPKKEIDRPKMKKGIIGLMTRKFGTEAQAHLMVQIMQGVKLFDTAGKRIVFNQTAFDYWSIREEQLIFSAA